MLSILRSVAELAKLGIEHRDMIASNILFRDDGTATIIDFNHALSAAMPFPATYAALLEHGRNDEHGQWDDLYTLGNL